MYSTTQSLNNETEKCHNPHMTTNITISVIEIRVRNWSAIFLKIGRFVGYWLPSHWKCTVKLADQNRCWLAKCWNWLENGQWPTAISSTEYNTYILYHNVLLSDESLTMWLPCDIDTCTLICITHHSSLVAKLQWYKEPWM